MQKTRIMDKVVSGIKVSDKVVTVGETRTQGSDSVYKKNVAT